MTSPDPADIEPFEIALPTGEAGPLVFASPHSGGLRPDDLRPAAGVSIASLRSAEDALVDRLIASAPALGVPVIAGRISRAYVDLNRAPDELDPVLIGGAGPDVGAPPVSAKTAAGFGVIPRRAGDGQALYDRPVSLDEAGARLRAVHAPYHEALAVLMNQARIRHGRAVLIDWHSMPSRAAGGGRAAGAGRLPAGPDVVLGDRHGASCGAGVSRRVRSLFEAAGWRVGLNHPYAGGYTTQAWGRPAEGFEAIQIELNRALYLDEATLTPNPGFERCKRVIDRVIAALAAEVWGQADQG